MRIYIKLIFKKIILIFSLFCWEITLIINCNTFHHRSSMDLSLDLTCRHVKFMKYLLKRIWQSLFQFKETTHEHETVNSLTSAYSFPVGSLLLPLYKNNAGKESIRYICANIWNNILKELSIKNPEKYCFRSKLW